MSVAILIDGSFFLKRYEEVFCRKRNDPAQAARDLFTMALNHVEYITNQESKESTNTVPHLYRIFYYDAPPLGEENQRTQNPITKRHIVFNKTDEYNFRSRFLKELKEKRKVALRMGRLTTSGWKFKKSETVKQLCTGKITKENLESSHIEYSLSQKGVDMKIGLDIASIAYKKLASSIVLVSGDSDFVPAAKLARREGIDFILDPMWTGRITDDLFEHIDGLRSFPRRKKSPRKKKKK